MIGNDAWKMEVGGFREHSANRSSELQRDSMDGAGGDDCV